ncbi:MAG: DUF2905 family protein [Caldilineaceae bacterium]|nr:DUF2905 family protein [Caldilineaceae bacterium]
MQEALPTMGRLLIGLGVVLIFAGSLLLILPRIPIDNIPGNLRWNRPGMSVHIPLGTMAAVSIVLTVILNAVLYLFRRWG